MTYNMVITNRGASFRRGCAQNGKKHELHGNVIKKKVLALLRKGTYMYACPSMEKCLTCDYTIFNIVW